MPTCQGTKKNGTPCRRNVKEGQQYCWHHRPWYKRWRRTISRGLTAGFIVGGILAIIGLWADLSGLGLLRQRTTVSRMGGDFRVAVAGFALQGHSVSEGIGKELAEGVFLRLEETFDEIDLGFTTAVWGPDQVGMIQGKNEVDRAKAAAHIADTIGADMVIYGSVDVTDAVWQVVPEFYVATDSFFQAQEITGQHELGTPLSILGRGNVADRIEVSSELTSRSQVLSHIAIGLAYYAVRNYEKASESFQHAQATEEWDDDAGRKVLYLLIGNVAVKQNDFELAEEYYQQSLELDSDYARGYLGLADVYYRQAIKPFDETLEPAKTDIDLISRAVDAYRQATRAAYQPPLADIVTKAHFGLGQSYFMRVYSGNENSFNAAISEFQAVVEEYGDGANPRVQELAAESHARLGLIYDLSGRTSWAINEYQQAISLLNRNPDRRAEYENRLRKLTNQGDNTH